MAKLDRPPVFKRRWQVTLEDHIQSLEWSRDGSLLAAATISGPIAILDPGTGTTKQMLPGHGFGTLSLSWHPDHRRLASAGQDGKVRVWDAPAGAEIQHFPGGAAWVEQVSWSPNGKHLAIGAGKKLSLCNSALDQVHAYPDQPKSIADLVWTSHSREFLTGGFGGVTFWSPDQREPVKQFEWRGAILKLALSPDEKLLAAGSQESAVHFWFMKNGKDLEMSGYPLKVRELSWDADSRQLATGGGELVTVWNCSGKGPAGTTPVQLALHTEPIGALAFQHRGPMLASGCTSGKIALWYPAGQARHLGFGTLDEEEGVSQLAWSPSDGLLAVGGERGTIQVYSV